MWVVSLRVGLTSMSATSKAPDCQAQSIAKRSQSAGSCERYIPTGNGSAAFRRSASEAWNNFSEERRAADLSLAHRTVFELRPNGMPSFGRAGPTSSQLVPNSFHTEWGTTPARSGHCPLRPDLFVT
jgi:hypothetical protein